MSEYIDRTASHARVEAWKQEILDARTGHEWAFFNGTAQRDCPDVVRRVAELNALIAEHTCRGGTGDLRFS